MAKGDFALLDPQMPWTDEEWTRASLYTYVVWWSPEDDLFLARCVEVPGAISHGDTPEEAIHNATDSMAVYLDGFDSPPPPIRHDGELAYLLYTSDQVVEMLGVNKQRVHALAKSRGVGTKRGRDLLFTAQDIAAMRDRRNGRPATTGRVSTR
jgi:predicted RNase H-like HicB family nuclease